VSLFKNKLILKYFRRKKYVKIETKEELTGYEKRILEEISIGKSYHTIADELKISKDEVQKSIRDIYQKLQNHKID